MNKYWTDDSDTYNQQFLPTQALLDKFGLNELKFMELPGSGAGDQYIFQGKFELGRGSLHYNLAVYSLGPRISVACIEDHAMSKVSDQEYEAGVALAKKLTDTLPRSAFAKMRHSLPWLKKAWKTAKKY